MKKIIRCATIGLSLNIFCNGILQDLKKQGYEVIALSSPDDDLQELAIRENVRVVGVEMDRHINLIKDLKSLWSLVKVFRKENPDMVHSMTPKAGLLCMLAAWMARVPVRVHTFTGLVWPTEKGMKRRILMSTDWITCACATHVIPEGQGVLEDLQAHITKKPMRVLGYGNIRGIDLAYWRKREELEVRREKELTFLFVGRLVGDKGINELVKAFIKLIEMQELKNARIKKCRLVLVGGYEENLDPVKPETRQMIETMPEIEAVGPQYGEVLKAWYAAADCFVFPSYREGFPNTVIEAGAMELPCIVTDINGSREIIRPSQSTSKGEDLSLCNRKLNPGERMSTRENGVVIPSKDSEALYDAMVWIMEHEKERVDMGKRARVLVAERYEQGYVREQLYAFYREALS